jgi:hypothetical protein
MRWMIPVSASVLVGAAVLLLWNGAAPSQTAPAAKIDMRVLYAGDVGTARQKEFKELLGQYFTQVDTADVSKLQVADTAKCDVLIVDAEKKDGGESALDVPQLKLPDNFSKPTISLGVMGGLFTERRGLKIGYL